MWSVADAAYEKTTAGAIAALAFSGLGTLTTAALSHTTVLNDGANKTITLQNVLNVAGTLTALTLATLDAAADSLVVYDASGTATKRVLVSDAVRKVAETVVTTAGTATAYTATSGFTFTALADGLAINVKLHAASGAAPTFAPDGLAAKAIRTQDDVTPATAQFPINTLIRLVYNSSANSGAGGWLATGFSSNTGPIFAVLDGSVSVSTGRRASSTAATDRLTATGHGFSTGDLFWCQSNIAGLTKETPYYVIYVDANNWKVATSKANAATGTAVDITADGSSNIYYVKWASNPLLASRGIDGIIPIESTGGLMVVDFTTARASANYCPHVTVGFPTGSDGVFGAVYTGTLPTADLFYVYVTNSSTTRVFITVFE
jgi:hypothetical protein